MKKFTKKYKIKYRKKYKKKSNTKKLKKGRGIKKIERIDYHDKIDFSVLKQKFDNLQDGKKLYIKIVTNGPSQVKVAESKEGELLDIIDIDYKFDSLYDNDNYNNRPHLIKLKNNNGYTDTIYLNGDDDYQPLPGNATFIEGTSMGLRKEQIKRKRAITPEPNKTRYRSNISN